VRFWRLQHRLAPYLFISPFIILFCAFLLWPLARSLVLSCYKSAGPHRKYFVGLENYAFLLQDRFFWLAVGNTVGYALVFLAIQIPAALLLAVLLNSRRIVLRPIWRLAFFSTHLVGGAFVGILFIQILNPRYGLLNQSLSLLLRRPVEIQWLQEPKLAMVSVLLAGLWLYVGHAMVYYLAALQAVDRDLYEAAAVDGAGRVARFWHITLPGVRHVTAFLTLFGLIGTLQMFELPYLLHGQSAGPANSAMTIVTFLYIAGFQAGDLGLASAVGWILVLLTAGLALLHLRTAQMLGRRG